VGEEYVEVAVADPSHRARRQVRELGRGDERRVIGVDAEGD
jgi:hypothetical protein